MTMESLVNQQNFSDYETMAEDVCKEPTRAQIDFYSSLAWWLEGVAQIVLGCLGFIANGVAIPILLSKEMSSIFNRLLTCLAVFDNIFIVCSVLEGLRKHIITSQFQEYLFGYFLYQFHNMILCSCIYITVVLALERYRAVWRPVEYHNNVNSVKPWIRVANYIVPVVIFAFVFNVPKFFEAKFVEIMKQEFFEDPRTGEEFTVNSTHIQLAPTALRLDENYVLWYSNVARLVVTGIFPFASLTYLNFRIYTVIRRRRRMTNRPRCAPNAAKKAEEGRQAIVLIVIVVLFLICHTLRILLNIHGLFSLKMVRKNLMRGCSAATQHWTLIGASISHILLTINSSVNFIIYCFMCTTFRRIFYTWVNKVFGCRLPEVSSAEPSMAQDSSAPNNVRTIAHGISPETSRNVITPAGGQDVITENEQNEMNSVKVRSLEVGNSGMVEPDPSLPNGKFSNSSLNGTNQNDENSCAKMKEQSPRTIRFEHHLSDEEESLLHIIDEGKINKDPVEPINSAEQCNGTRNTRFCETNL